MSFLSEAKTKHRELGLTDAEHERIGELLGREPNDVELAMFSLLWSEHCAYKHSRKLLRRLPVEGARLLIGPGENAGAVDVGAGYAIAFKVESHNHPTAVEPFQGAATGIGGILRDVFAIGARPIAILDSLRFGEPGSERSRYLFDRAVAGIGHYGNSIGVPTVGGEVYFEPPYERNCLVNAMCVGLARADAMLRSAAAGVGNAVVLLGASTGRDGIGGASVLASEELTDDADKRPSVQIGDPFEEKKLMECCLELLDRGLLVALQDLGAAGLTSSSAEMASAGGVGIDIHLDAVPLREEDMEPFEIMISESQERMLAVVEPDRIDENRASLGPSASPSEVLIALLASPNVASKRWAYDQYDSIVQSRTVRRPEEADAAVLQLEETGGAIGIAIDGNGRRVACDPYLGTVEAVLECAQNLACVGAEPLGVTNCLNFGNPERATVAWQLDRSVEGLADACRSLGVPVVGGNVSLYNETEAGAIYPTPVIGMVGEVPDPRRVAGMAFAEGDTIALVGPFAPSIAGSELAKLRGDLGLGLPGVRVHPVRAAIELVREAVRSGAVTRAHDVSDGGLACALAECSIAGGVGVRADLDPLVELRGGSGESCLFGEGPGGLVVAGRAAELGALAAEGDRRGIDVLPIGEAAGTTIEISAAEADVCVPLGEAERAWRSLSVR
jgi:phosphoribosylformylglycinamidine (FGAM) synthase-like enzyme